MCVDDLHILSPSTTMSFLIRERENEGEKERLKKRKRKEEGRKDEDESSLDHNQPREDGGEEGDEGMKVDECVAGPPQTSRRSQSEGPGAKPCVSLLFLLRSKQGVAFRNLQSSSEAHALTLSFVVKATGLGDVQVWDRDPKNCRVEERETKGAEITVRGYKPSFTHIIIL